MIPLSVVYLLLFNLNKTILTMEPHTYKKIEITGTSGKSLEDAIENAIDKASQTVEDMRWFEVTETRGSIEDGTVAEWQVGLKIGFTLK